VLLQEVIRKSLHCTNKLQYVTRRFIRNSSYRKEYIKAMSWYSTKLMCFTSSIHLTYFTLLTWWFISRSLRFGYK
jgi:hypothetical protein